jgi:hypothetical protein
MHNHNGKKDSGMMWMMAICCGLPLLILLFAGGSLSSSGYFWPALVGVMVVAYLAMMWRGHGRHSDSDSDQNDALHAVEKKQTGGKADSAEQPKKGEHKQGGGCCH